MFLTVFTRCCRRPKMLRKNICSVLAQSCLDWEQLFVVDQTGRHGEDPILWANCQFERYQGYVSGDYIYPLDDDGVMVGGGVFSTIKAAVNDEPDVVLVKIKTPYHDGALRVWPEKHVWRLDWEAGERPERWAGNGYNVYTKTNVWKDHLSHYQRPKGGDWHYITSLIEDDLYIKQADVISAKSLMRGRGIVFEKCGRDWFDDIARDYKLENVAESVWRLRP